MGQYYYPIALGKKKRSIKGYFLAHAYDNGLKLMEHSYLRNNFVAAVMTYLNKVGGGRLVWAGDYADEEPDTFKITKEQALPIWQAKVNEGIITCSFDEFYKSKDESLYDENNENASNLYHLCKGRPQITIASEDIKEQNFRFIVNEDKKEIVDLWDVVSFDGWEVHPLPLLTAEGNGRGGGDYDGTSMSLVGSWARDNIKVLSEVDYTTINNFKARGYKVINPLFAETYSIERTLGNIVKAYTNLKEEAIGGELSKRDKDNIKAHIKALRELIKVEKEPKTAEAKIEVEAQNAEVSQ